MATNFVTSSLGTFPNPDPTKVLRQLLLKTVSPTMKFTYFKDGIKDYYTYHYAKISDINSDVSSGALLGYASVTAGGSTTLLPITCQVKQLKLTPEFYTGEKLNETTANIFEKKGTDPEKAAPTILLDTVKALKGDAIGTFNEKYIWQSDTSTTLQTNGTVLGAVDGLISQIRGGISGSFANCGGFSTNAPATDLTTLQDASVRDHVKYLYNKAVSINPAIANIETLMFMSPGNYNALYSAVYGLGGQIDKLTVGENAFPEKFALPITGDKCYAVNTVGLSGRNNIVLTRSENICVIMDDSTETNFMDLWYNKAAKGWELDVAWKIGAKVADVSDCFVTK